MYRLQHNETIREANRHVVELLGRSEPCWVGVDTALQVIPGMTECTILHAGPPIAFEAMCGAMKGAVAGALIFEGLAASYEEALAVARSGRITFAPCNDHDAVAPMAGIISASMPVIIVEDKTYHTRAFAPFNEGNGKVLQQGANDPGTILRQRYMRDELAPLLERIVSRMGGLDIKEIIAQSLHMGDECHNRTKAATALFLMKLLPYLLEEEREQAARAADLIRDTDSFFLNFSMAACKAGLDAAHGIAHSTIVTTMSRNGVEFGIKLSGLPKDAWFTGPAQQVIGIYFEGYAPGDGNRDMGDSAIVETMGLGGFAMSAAPAIAQYIGGTAEDAINCSLRMYEITASENSNYTVPADNFRGLPLGIDALQVVGKRVLPIISTAIAHKDPDIGQVGAGISTPPQECFEKAVNEFAKYYGYPWE
ncbi:DUF1116 domain-containing protein [Lacrimispora sp.]|uniref:DUF1116 domain-containing protein n=1 Tax=Lacrimispora sp. TaxID=2719234 RepID=UPI002FD9EC2E